ncbi:DUF2339 domain-containing protein, partial [Nocardia farcinica]|uniref:DUF2339 domain-containing protein n=1 Tax=Nocardia farcinica TaxID=37329 RepID=UPI0024549682
GGAVGRRFNTPPGGGLRGGGGPGAAPFVTTAPVLLGFLVVAQLSCLPVHRMRDWPYLHLARTLPVVFATVAFIAVAGLSDARGHVGAVLAASIAVAVVGLAGTLLVQRIRPTDVTASYALAAAAAPLLVAPPTLLDRWPAVALAACYAAVLLAVAAAHLAPATRARTGITSHTAVVAAVLGAVALLEACVGGANTRTLALVLFLAALAFSGVAGHQRSRVAAVLGAAFAVLGGLVFLDDAGPAVLASRVLARDHLGIDTAVTALAGLAVLAATVWSLRRMSTAAGSAGAGNPVVWVATSVAALYLVSAAAVAVGVAAGGTDGFVVGHCVATILWMAGATGALFHGLRNLSAGSGAIVKVALGSGLLLTAAAIAKLFLFDLATLDGFVRVSAFLAVGVLLLLTGTRYARAFAEAGERAGRERDAVPSGAAPGAPGPAGDQSVSS